MRFWQPLGSKTEVTHSLPHAGNESQQSINSYWFCILGNEGIARIHKLITQLLTTFLGKNTKDKWKNTDSTIIDIAHCNTCKKRLFAAEYVMLIRYYYLTSKTRVL